MEVVMLPLAWICEETTLEARAKVPGTKFLDIFLSRYLTDRSKRQKINEVIATEEGIAMASEVLIRISKDEAERARLMSEWKYVVDTQSKVVQAKREGRKEGRKEGRSEVARTLKALGDSVEKIAQATGLSIEDIAKL